MNALTKDQLALILDSVLTQLLAAAEKQVEDPEELIKSLSRFKDCVSILTEQEGEITTFQEVDDLVSLIVDMYYQEDYTEAEVDFINLPSTSPYLH
ncbi:hypothetical protein SP3_00038 [Bacillus phage fHSPT3]|nr:hypothetical protein TIMEGRIFFIN_124 [Bacillus phage vB_BspH_TimeGriffin]